MKMLKALCVFYALSALVLPAMFAQTSTVSATPITDTDIQLLRSDVQADKNKIIADTMSFTEPESSAFWPVYRDYSRDQQAIGDERVQLIKDYAQQYDKLDDAKAKELSERLMNIDAKTVNLRRDYWPKFEKALGGRRAAKFYQVDNRLSMMINLQLAAAIPLVP
jgi:hypothetical protein